MKNFIDFFHISGRLKDIKRSGWKLYKVKGPESVADHSWRMALMALLLAKKFGFNENKAIKLALVHDLAESVTGDYIPGEISLISKKQKEQKVIRRLCKNLGADGKGLFILWREYNSQRSNEATLVKEIDRLEMALQAKEYEIEKRAKNLQTFINSAEGFLKNDQMIKMFQIIKNLKTNKGKQNSKAIH